jgi:glycosyltransferase involved in cell wall biosynthesis
MTSIALIIGRSLDAQTQDWADSLARGLGKDFRIHQCAIGRNVRNALAQIRWIRRNAPDTTLIHTFGADALTTAALGFDGPIAHTPSGFPSSRHIGWMRAVAGYRNLQIISPTTTQWRAIVSKGLPADRCHVIHPGADFSRIRRRRDDALRAALGFGPDDFVLLAAGESTYAASHDRAVQAAAILNKMNPSVKLLLWGRGSRAAALLRSTRRMGSDGWVVSATQRLRPSIRFEELIPAADFVLVSATGPAPTLPITIAMAAALPIVSTVTYTAAELLEDRHTAMMVSDPIPREIARRIVELRADPAMQWTIADNARAEAYEFFSMTRFLDEHRKLYRQCRPSNDPASAPPVGPDSLSSAKSANAGLLTQ